MNLTTLISHSCLTAVSKIMRSIFIFFMSLILIACHTTHKTIVTKPVTKRYVQSHPKPSVNATLELKRGKDCFKQGYYKRAMHLLLPLACDGFSEAQYAVGFMYYYGLGVVQDTDVGFFWIQRAADQGYYAAVQALEMIHNGMATHPPVEQK